MQRKSSAPWPKRLANGCGRWRCGLWACTTVAESPPPVSRALRGGGRIELRVAARCGAKAGEATSQAFWLLTTKDGTAVEVSETTALAVILHDKGHA